MFLPEGSGNSLEILITSTLGACMHKYHSRVLLTEIDKLMCRFPINQKKLHTINFLDLSKKEYKKKNKKDSMDDFFSVIIAYIVKNKTPQKTK